MSADAEDGHGPEDPAEVSEGPTSTVQPIGTAAAQPAPRASLSSRILRETARFAALQVVASILAWSANIALARLLERRDFGVYGICSFYIGVGALLGDGGLGATLLRRKTEPTPEEFRVTVTSLLAVAATMGATLFFAAPWIGAHNHLTARETYVLRAMSPLFLVSALRVVPYIRMERQLMFSRIARIELTAAVVRHVLAISLALIKGGVWALVASNLVGASLQLTLAYRASPGWVGLGWSWKTFRPLITYGSKVQALGICAYFKDNISRALLGGALGPGAVGLFDFGLAYIQVPVTAVNSLARVQLPVYARLEANDPDLYKALRGATRTALLLGIPLLFGLALAAPWIVPTVYSPRWVLAYPVIWGLVGNMIGGLVASPLFTLLQGQGYAGRAVSVFLFWTILTWVLAIAAVVLFPGNLLLIALAHSVVTLVVTFGMVLWAGRHLGRGLTRAYAAPLAAGMIGLAVGAAAARFGGGWVHHPLVAAGLCMGVYVLALLAMERGVVLAEIKQVVRGTRGKAAVAESGTKPSTAESLGRAA